MVSFRFQALCPKCGKPLLMGTGKTGDGSVITEYRCRGTKRVRVADRDSQKGFASMMIIVRHCGFNKVIISNEHMVTMKRRTTLSWEGLVAVYDKDYSVPVDRGAYNVST